MPIRRHLQNEHKLLLEDGDGNAYEGLLEKKDLDEIVARLASVDLISYNTIVQS